MLFLSIGWGNLATANAASTSQNKQLNFVFLHGMNGNSGALQLLADSMTDRLPAYVSNHQSDHQGTNIQTDMINRNYPNNVDIESWAKNIADSINQRFAGKKNLVLIGHSMGGKTALYAVAHNIGNLADKVAMVVTINSPVRSLVNYYYLGGDTALDFWGAQMLSSDKGVLQSLVNYDSAADGRWVGTHKHWLAFVSSESSPLSAQFDTSGIDPLPRVMDDQIVPISCQYSEGADVVYYGEYGHSQFSNLNPVSGYMADQILGYIFGNKVECASLSRSGSFEHKSGLWPGTDRWQDMVGGVLAATGSINHTNDSLFKWQSWEDTVGSAALSETRSTFQIKVASSSPFFSGLTQAGWADEDNPQDGRVELKTRSAPHSSVKVDWNVYQPGLLPSGTQRDHYEVEIETGTQLTSISGVSWQSSDTRDLRLQISSEAQKPFRWFKAQWRVYYKLSHQFNLMERLTD
jgi:pimeloyl-ACP methyl ester carboxylesterase